MRPSEMKNGRIERRRLQMNGLFEYATQSIQLGVEDYQSNDPRRGLSPVDAALSQMTGMKITPAPPSLIRRCV